MSARFLASLKPTHGVGHKAVNAALLVALAINQSPSTVNRESVYRRDCIEPPPGCSNRPAPICCSNSAELLQAVERSHGIATYVPLFLHPDSFIDDLDSDALQEVMDAISKGRSNLDVQWLIHNRFPASNFSQHLFTRIRIFLAGKPFLEPSLSSPMSAGKKWLMRKLCGFSPVETRDGEAIVAIKHLELAQRWFGTHFRTVGQIVQASLLFGLQVTGFTDDGSPVVLPDVRTERYPYREFTNDEIRELYALSSHFTHVREDFITKVRALKAELDLRTRKEWSAYAKRTGLTGWGMVNNFCRMQRSLYAATWMLAFAPPDFFANHRNQFAELADLLTSVGGEINGPSTQMLRNLSLLGRAMRDLRLTHEDLSPFKEHCHAVAAHKHFSAPNTPFL
eukprot:Blabericola_migrator_1__8204@NODE_4244_length_1262_cov_12_911297_g2624_i0_p1_GENE_NODE_4244_length_1262_cov_12_911297_g2624_i0NODE_4244_length_1262_cov_12_911297_g2624_i0_p1_ORF_typecomplete_len395_score37_83DNA_ligase_IV/PF11411_8/0_25_NODE_4244_length_1262_cov_12_911297_g2624_i0481232